MYYQTPSLEKYVTKVIKYRISILLFFLVSFITVFLDFQPKFISSDDIYWLKESEQLQISQAKIQDNLILSKLQIDVSKLNPSTQKKLQSLHKQLEKYEKIERVLSLFSHTIIQKDQKENESSMLGVISISSLENYKIKSFINELSNPNEKFVENDFHTFNFFLFSKEAVDLNALDIPFNYTTQTISKCT